MCDESASISVVAETPAQSAAAAAYARSLDLPLLPDFESSESAIDPDALLLVVTAQGLEIREAAHPRTKGVVARVTPPGVRGSGGGGPGGRLSRRAPLGRAVGPKARTVLDATAGLGRDAGFFVAMGYAVTAVERAPVLVALLRDAKERAGIALEVVCGDARVVIAGRAVPPDAVYVDPMYPPKRKASALARKSVRLIRRLVGDDDDAADLLRVARAHATQRVVVKRPGHADPLAPDPSFTIESKLVRYDVYVSASGVASS